MERHPELSGRCVLRLQALLRELGLVWHEGSSKAGRYVVKGSVG